MENYLREIKSPLIGLISQSDDIVRMLVSRDINYVVDDMTALIYCLKLLERGGLEEKSGVIKSVLMKLIAWPNSDLEMEDFMERRPLEIVVSNDLGMDIAQKLLQYGANPNIYSYPDGNLIVYLIRIERPDYADLLLEYSANPSYRLFMSHISDRPIIRAIEMNYPKTLMLVSSNMEYISEIRYIRKQYSGLKVQKELLRIIYSNIVYEGKISTLDFLGLSDKKRVIRIVSWLDSIIEARKTMTNDELKKMFSYPIKKMKVGSKNNKDNFFDYVMKMMLFKKNIESMINMQINIPATKYIHIVLIFIFIMKNSHLNPLNNDIIKIILCKIFN